LCDWELTPTKLFEQFWDFLVRWIKNPLLLLFILKRESWDQPSWFLLFLIRSRPLKNASRGLITITIVYKITLNCAATNLSTAFVIMSGPITFLYGGIVYEKTTYN
jgi:hypothetical protein